MGLYQNFLKNTHQVIFEIRLKRQKRTRLSLTITPTRNAFNAELMRKPCTSCKLSWLNFRIGYVYLMKELWLFSKEETLQEKAA